MVAAGILNDGSLDAVDPIADETISQSQSPQKRPRLASAVAGGAKVGGELDREMTGDFAQDSGAGETNQFNMVERSSRNRNTSQRDGEHPSKATKEPQSMTERKMMTRSAKDAMRDDAAIEENKAGQQTPGQQDRNDTLEA